jgi:hypothetical protein
VLITSLISVVAIFISYYLGRKTKIKDRTESKLEERYYKFYIPLLTKGLKTSFYDYQYVMDFFGLDFVVFLLDSIPYMGNKSVKYIKDLYSYGQDFYMFGCDYSGQMKVAPKEIQELHDKNMETGNKIFNSFMEICKEEAAEIAEELKLEPISKSL